MAIKKGGPKRLERKQPPPASLGGTNAAEASSDAKGQDAGAQHSTPYHVQAAAATHAYTASSKANRKRGQSKSVSAQKKRERGVELAARLTAKAHKRTERTDKRKRAKEVPR